MMSYLSSQMRNSENSPHNYRVYASFCPKDPTLSINKSNWIDCYTPSNNSWHRVTMIPGLFDDHVLKDFAMVTLGDDIYVIGGRLCHKVIGRDPEEIVEVDLEVLPSVLCYNVRADVWSKCAPLGVARFDFACTVSSDKIYVAGGQSLLRCARGISSAEVYDPALDEWRSLPSMNTLRYKCVGVTWQGKVHVVGGFVERGDSDSPGPYIMERSSAEVYDTRCARWEIVPRMWELDVPPNQIVAVGGRLFSSGNCLNAWKGYIEAYDVKHNIWNVVDGSNLHTLSSPVSTSDASEANWPPIQRLYLTVAPIGTHLYFLAGYRMPGEMSRLRSAVHVFDTSANEDGWTSFEPMEEEGEKELCGHCCVVKQVP